MPSIRCPSCKQNILNLPDNFRDTIQCDSCAVVLRAVVRKGIVVDARLRTINLDIPETAPLIKQAFELFATGRYERAEVIRIVTASGLRTKKRRKLSQKSFCNMLKNPFYAGKLVVGQWETDCKGAFEPIVNLWHG